MVDTAPPPADQPAHVNGPASVPATPAAPEAEASDYDERGDLCDAEYSVAHTLTGHARAVSSVRFSHSGACLASASADGTARIWNTDTGACLAVLQGHTKVSALSLRCVEAMGAWAGKDFSWVGRCVRCRALQARVSPRNHPQPLAWFPARATPSPLHAFPPTRRPIPSRVCQTWRGPPATPTSQPLRTTERCGCGKPRRGLRCAYCVATRTTSCPAPSAPAARCWSAPGLTRRSWCGTWPPGQPSAPSPRTPIPSPASPFPASCTRPPSCPRPLMASCARRRHWMILGGGRLRRHAAACHAPARAAAPGGKKGWFGSGTASPAWPGSPISFAKTPQSPLPSDDCGRRTPATAWRACWPQGAHPRPLAASRPMTSTFSPVRLGWVVFGDWRVSGGSRADWGLRLAVGSSRHRCSEEAGSPRRARLPAGRETGSPGIDGTCPCVTRFPTPPPPHAGRMDGKLVMWNYRNKQPIRTFEGHKNNKFCLQVRPGCRCGRAWRGRAEIKSRGGAMALHGAWALHSQRRLHVRSGHPSKPRRVPSQPPQHTHLHRRPFRRPAQSKWTKRARHRHW